MPDASTAHLALPLLQAAQAQKHVTHNEALVALDTLVQLAVLDKDLTAPPASPAEGDRYLIAGAAPTGAWAGWAGRVVRYQDGAWRSFAPRPGWLAVVADEADLYTYTGVGWVSFRSTLTALQNLARLGIGTTADAANPFAAKLNTALWTALTSGEGGSGDLRYTLNKEAAGNILSLLFQSGFSGRAELGLTGDDDLRLKVSADGGTWREALRVDRATGGLDFAAAEASVPVAATVDLGAVAVLKVALTGSGTVTSFGTVPHRVRLVRFTATATLTHNAASLALPGGASLVTAAGDTALATSDAAGNWRVLDYVRASGKPVTGPAAADVTDAGASGLSVLTGTPAQGATALGLGTDNSPAFAGASFSAPIVAKVGTAAASTGQPSGTFAATVFNSVNASTGNGLLVKTRWLAPASAILEVGIDQNGGSYLSALRVDGGRATTLGGALTVMGSATFGSTVSAATYFQIPNAGVAAPSFATRSAGTKLLLNSALNSAQVDYAIGIAGSTLWFSIPDTNTARKFKWFGGETEIASIDGGGNLVAAGSLAAAATIRPGSYTVATVPASVVGALIYVSNARKVGEASGAGTGAIAYFSNGSWRRPSDDTAVAA